MHLAVICTSLLVFGFVAEVSGADKEKNTDVAACKNRCPFDKKGKLHKNLSPQAKKWCDQHCKPQKKIQSPIKETRSDENKETESYQNKETGSDPDKETGNDQNKETSDLEGNDETNQKIRQKRFGLKLNGRYGRRHLNGRFYLGLSGGAGKRGRGGRRRHRVGKGRRRQMGDRRRGHRRKGAAPNRFRNRARRPGRRRIHNRRRNRLRQPFRRRNRRPIYRGWNKGAFENEDSYASVSPPEREMDTDCENDNSPALCYNVHTQRMKIPICPLGKQEESAPEPYTAARKPYPDNPDYPDRRIKPDMGPDDLDYIPDRRIKPDMGSDDRDYIPDRRIKPDIVPDDLDYIQEPSNTDDYEGTDRRIDPDYDSPHPLDELIEPDDEERIPYTPDRRKNPDYEGSNPPFVPDPRIDPDYDEINPPDRRIIPDHDGRYPPDRRINPDSQDIYSTIIPDRKIEPDYDERYPEDTRIDPDDNGARFRILADRKMNIDYEGYMPGRKMDSDYEGRYLAYSPDGKINPQYIERYTSDRKLNYEFDRRYPEYAEYPEDNEIYPVKDIRYRPVRPVAPCVTSKSRRPAIIVKRAMTNPETKTPSKDLPELQEITKILPKIYKDIASKITGGKPEVIVDGTPKKNKGSNPMAHVKVKRKSKKAPAKKVKSHKIPKKDAHPKTTEKMSKKPKPS